MRPEWILLLAISLPFVLWGSINAAPAKTRVADNLASQHQIAFDAYVFTYIARQMYGCDPDDLNKVQLASVDRSCRCNQAMDKCTTHGINSLTDDECELVLEVLPKRYPSLKEFPGYERILRACRKRLAEEPNVRPWR